MLIVTRAIGEKIIIGDDVIAVITGIEGSRVKIGIDAPKEIPVRLKKHSDTPKQ